MLKRVTHLLLCNRPISLGGDLDVELDKKRVILPKNKKAPSLNTNETIMRLTLNESEQWIHGKKRARFFTAERVVDKSRIDSIYWKIHKEINTFMCPKKRCQETYTSSYMHNAVYIHYRRFKDFTYRVYFYDIRMCHHVLSNLFWAVGNDNILRMVRTYTW